MMISRRLKPQVLVFISLNVLFAKVSTLQLPFAKQRIFSALKTINDELSLLDIINSDIEEKKFIWSRQWYPVRPISYLQDIGNKALPIRILGRNLVVWKGSTWSVMEDECPHRRAPLSTGKVVNGCNIMCRFHGWQFDSAGNCKDIPMYPRENEMDASKYENLMNNIHVNSYPTQVAGGLLWVYLGDDLDSNGNPPKPIRQDMLLPEEVASKTEFMVNKVPVSYTSMVENSFDPSHAPFIHEGIKDFGGGIFSPAGALAMKKYQLLPNTTINANGFTYQKGGVENAMVTRQFIPPTVQKSKFPFFDVVLYFIPVDVRETMVIGTFPTPPLPKYLPNRFVEFLKDTLHFVYIISEVSRRFYKQDMITMRGQDTRKLIEVNLDVGKTVVDMAPTPADVSCYDCSSISDRST
jgi:phenylpropionate dioxygenase-like ring-hydroxylating dioxygenase large terminal subunit